jgi:hypothetical protein
MLAGFHECGGEKGLFTCNNIPRGYIWTAFASTLRRAYKTPSLLGLTGSAECPSGWVMLLQDCAEPARET